MIEHDWEAGICTNCGIPQTKHSAAFPCRPGKQKYDELPPPHQVELEPVPTIPAHKLGVPLWSPPESPQGLLNLFRRVRDLEVWSLKARLEQALGPVLSVDEPLAQSSLAMLWESGLAPVLSWSDRYGAIGPAMVLKERLGLPGGVSRFLAMVQVSGAEMDDLTFSQAAPSLYIRAVRHPENGRMHIITDVNFFLSLLGMKKYGDPDTYRALKPDTRVWYKVLPSHWEFFVDRLVRAPR